jgi:orotidine-5'-phosphate decarboxylase
MRQAIIATLCLAIPASLAFSAPAEAKRFRFSLGSSKPAVKPSAAVAPATARGGSTLIIMPGIGSAQAATQPENAERRRLEAARQEEQAEAERKDAARRLAEAQRAASAQRQEIPRLGSLSLAETKPNVPGFATLN